MATTSIAQREKCPTCGSPMRQRPDSEMTPEQRFCGTWVECTRPGCWTSVLYQSDGLKDFLAEQAIAHAKGEVERLETALAAKPRGRQRERIEVWLQGARVALAIAERKGTDMATTTTIIRKGMRVRLVEDAGTRGKVTGVKTVDRTVRPDGEKLLIVALDDGRELTLWAWQVEREA
jgi:hypothetical protein